MRKYLILILLFFLKSSFSFSQSELNKFRYIDSSLLQANATYIIGSYYAMDFELSYMTCLKIDNINYKPDRVSCRGQYMKSFIVEEDSKEFFGVKSLGVRFNNNYNFVLAYRLSRQNNQTIADISAFYIEDGVPYNFPNRFAKYSISGRKIIPEPYKDGTNNFLLKFQLGEGNYLIMKDYTRFYKLKLDGYLCELEIRD